MLLEFVRVSEMKRLIAALLFNLGLALSGEAVAQALLPNGQQQFVDANGSPLAAGKVYFYVPTTTTPKTTWQDIGLSAANTNPIVLDSAGRATIWGVGAYRQVLQDQFGNTIWDQISQALSGPLGSVETQAALKALPGGSFTSVTRLGYLAAGDGGQATYTWNAGSSCSDDGGSCIAPNSGSGRWILPYLPSASVAIWGGFAGNDATSQIQAAVNFGCITGTRIWLPSSGSAYLISNTIQIGNGSSGSVSTQNGCVLTGAGTGVASGEVVPNGTPVRLQWTGINGGVMLSVNGPIWGLSIRGLILDGNNLASTGLSMHHPISSQFEEILVENWGQGGGFAYLLDAYPIFSNGASGSIAVGAQHNTFVGIRSSTPTAGSSAGGIKIGADNFSTFSDVAQDSFIDSHFGYDATALSSGKGILLRYADNLAFYQSSTQPYFGTAGTGLFIQPPTGSGTFPGEISFYNSAILGGVNNPGGGWTAQGGIGFFPYPTSDGEPIPTANSFGQYYGTTVSGKLFGTPTPISILGSSGTGIATAGATDYVGLACFDTAQLSCPASVTQNGIVTRLRGQSSVIPAAGESVTLTLMNNQVATAASCVLTHTNNYCDTGPISVIVSKGDLLAARSVGSAAGPAAIINWFVTQDAQHDGSF